MLTKKGIVWIIISIIVLGFIVGLDSELILHEIGFLYAAIIILVSIFAKELAGDYFYVNIEHSIWNFQRYGWYEKSKFKKPIPMGLIFPFFITLGSAGLIKPMTLLQFDGTPSKKRILKKRGRIRKAEINESDLAFISAWGILAVLILAIISAAFKQPELAKYAVYYGMWNLIPFGQLDGSKLFFGSFFTWTILLIIYAISIVTIIF